MAFGRKKYVEQKRVGDLNRSASSKFVVRKTPDPVTINMPPSSSNIVNMKDARTANNLSEYVDDKTMDNSAKQPKSSKKEKHGLRRKSKKIKNEIFIPAGKPKEHAGFDAFPTAVPAEPPEFQNMPSPAQTKPANPEPVQGYPVQQEKAQTFSEVASLAAQKAAEKSSQEGFDQIVSGQAAGQTQRISNVSNTANSGNHFQDSTQMPTRQTQALPKVGFVPGLSDSQLPDIDLSDSSNTSDLQRHKKQPSIQETELSGAAKRKKNKRAKKIRKILIIVFSILFLELIAGGIYLYISDNFMIERIEISGADHLTEEEVLKLAAVPDNTTLIRVDTDTIKKRLKMDAWVKDVNIVRSFPSTLQINITERTIAAIVEVPTSTSEGVSTSSSSSTQSPETTVRNWAISSDYIWLMPIPDQNSEAGKAINQQIYSDVAGVMHIVDVSPSVQPEIGSQCTDENVKCAIGIVVSMTTSLKDQVKNVKAADPYSTTLVLKNGVEIAIGTSEDIRDKERVCLELLKKYEGKITFINVRTVSNPTWRTI